MDSDYVAVNSSTTEYQWPFLGLFVIPMCTIWGNVLVCVSVYMEKRLQNRFNFFLVSLAISDSLCALLVMPVSAWNMIKSNSSQDVPRGLCLAWYSLDVFFTSTTIIHLCSISLDRYFVLNNPLKYHNTKIRSSLPLKIGIAWLIPFCIACPLFIFALSIENGLGNSLSVRGFYSNLSNQSSHGPDSYKGCGPHNVYFIIIATVVTFVLPLIIMIVMYVLTVYSIIRQTNQARQNLFSGGSTSKSNPVTQIRITDDSQSANETTNSIDNMSYSMVGIDDTYISQSSISINSFDSNVNDPSYRLCYGGGFNTHLHVPHLSIRRSLDSAQPAVMKSASSSIRNQLAYNKNISSTPTHFVAKTSSGKFFTGSFRANKQSRNSAKRTLAAMNSGKKAVQVLGILFVLFLLCYLPFFVIYLLDFFCATCQQTTGPLVSKTEWIGYSASMLNPIVYHIFNPTFRNTFNRLMKGDCYKVRRTHASQMKSLV